MFQDRFNDDEIDAALIDLDVHALKSGASYYQTVGWNNVYRMDQGETVNLPRIGTVEILKNTWTDKDYDEMPQGGEDFMIVLRVRGDDRFFAKRGHKDSYGGIEWHGGMERISGKLKTITVFE